MSEIPFEQQVNWAPTAQSAISLLTDDEVIITVKGNLSLGIPIINNYQIPFSQNQDITEYVKQFLPVNAPSTEETASYTADTISDTTGSLI